MFDAKFVAARWYLGELSGEEMPGVACQALELGHDGKNLRCLAGLTNPLRRDIAEVVDGSLRELGVHTPITRRDAALWMARRVSGEIVEGRIEPYAGACRIWLSYSSDASELEHWSNLVTNYEVATDSGEVENAKQRIVQAAQNLRNDSAFGATVARFQKFLRQNKFPDNIVWLMPEDILLSGKLFVYVHVPIPDINEAKARTIYDKGVAHGRGLLISTICEMNGSTCCYVWYPRHQADEPQGGWPRDGSAKLSAKLETSRVLAKPVKSRLLWAFLKVQHRRKQNLKDFLFS